jgi:uncharacterized membrane protein YozB (DUF420 family)
MPDQTLATISLIIQWAVFILLIMSWILAYKKNIKVHHRLMFILAAIDFISVLYMIFSLLTVFQSLLGPPITLIHSLFGLLVSFLILYTLIVMTFPEMVPTGIKIKNTKLLMRITAILWLVLVFSGSFLYVSWYLGS